MAHRDSSYQTFQYPTGKNDAEGLFAFAEDTRENAREFRMDIERSAMGNILTYLGLHWVKFDTSSRVYRPIQLKKRVPRPVTNKFATVVASVASRLIAQKPPLSINAGSTDIDDIAAAEVGDKIRQIIEKEANIRELKPHAAAWDLLTGNVFYISNYDLSSRSGEDFIPFDQCLTCGQVSSPVEIKATGGMCPKCGSPEGPQFMPAADEKGKPIGVKQPRGRHYTEIKSIFDCDFDYEVPMIEDSPYFIVRELQSYQWVKQTYGQAMADKVPQERGQTDRQTYFTQALAYTSSAPGRYISGGSVAATTEPRIRVTRMWFKPSDDYPDGIYAVLLGEKELAESLDLPYHNEKGDPFVPVVHTKFDHVPGRVYGKTRADDIRPKQFQRNRLEAILELHSRRMVNSMWLLPEGVGVSRISGEQGQFLRYNALAGVPAPTRIPGDNPPPYLMEWLMRIDMEIDDLFGSKEILRGEVPEGVSAYSAIALIDERARQNQSSLMENWALGWMKWTRQNLDIWREYAETERTLSTGYGLWEIEKFDKSRFIGGVDVSVELGEQRPTTAIAKRAALEQAARTGAFNVMDPMERYRYLESLGVPELMEDFKLDMIEAERENDMLAQGQPVPPPMPWHMHPVHIARHRRFTMSDKFRQLPPPIQGLTLEHMMLHNEFMAAAQMQLRPGQAAPAGPAGGSKGSAKGDQAGSEKEVLQREAQNASPDTFSG